MKSVNQKQSASRPHCSALPLWEREAAPRALTLARSSAETHRKLPPRSRGRSAVPAAESGAGRGGWVLRAGTAAVAGSGAPRGRSGGRPYRECGELLGRHGGEQLGQQQQQRHPHPGAAAGSSSGKRRRGTIPGMSLPPTPALRLGGPRSGPFLVFNPHPLELGAGSAAGSFPPLSTSTGQGAAARRCSPASSSLGAPRLRAALSPLRLRPPSDGGRGDKAGGVCGRLDPPTPPHRVRRLRGEGTAAAAGLAVCDLAETLVPFSSYPPPAQPGLRFLLPDFAG